MDPLTEPTSVRYALQNLLESARELSGASWGTIVVLDHGDGFATVHAGTPRATPIELAARVARAKTPDENLPDSNLLVATIELHEYTYGRLYLCDKPGGFTSQDVHTVLTLIRMGAVAIENARVYQKASQRAEWMSVSQELTTLLLSGAEEDDALTLIAKRVREVARADTSALVLPSLGDTWACEIAEGEQSKELIGTLFPPDGRALTTLAKGTGLIVDSLASTKPLRVRVLANFGPAMYAPMIQHGKGVGVMLLLRKVGAAPFTAQDLEIAELVAGQATMAFELALAQHAEEMATLLDERARIGRDLHDLAIQQLFATGMQITSARERILSSAQAQEHLESIQALDDSLRAVDDSVGQIRSIVRSMRDRDEEVGAVERLRREASLARTSLGFAPSLVLTVDGQSLAHVERDIEDELIEAVDKAITDDLADDLVAVVREGLSNVARHAHASSAAVDIKINGVCGECAAVGVVKLSSDRPSVEIVLRDDGVGVDPTVTRRSGTANMAERARRHGGSFVIGPRARSDGERRGTCFTWRAPLD